MAAVSARLRSDPLRFSKRGVSANEMRRLIAEAAYFRAEARGFAAGNEVEDWVAAEREITEHVVIVAPMPAE